MTAKCYILVAIINEIKRADEEQTHTPLELHLAISEL